MSELKQQHITFYSAWINEYLIGCDALKELTSQHGEVKSMRTAQQYLRRAVAKDILIHIIEEARSRGYKKLSLETRVMDVFKAA